MGQNITQKEADQMLKDDMIAYELKVDKYNSIYSWNQNEFDALTSFAYNVGSIDQLTAKGTRSRAVIAEKMLLYNKAAGKVLAGLTRRRRAEQELFLTPVTELVQLGWIECDGKWYYRVAEGINAHGWKLINHHWYYFNDTGLMLTGW